MRNKKLTITNIIIFIALIALTYYLIFRHQSINNIINAIKNVNILFVILGFLFMFMYIFMEALNLKCILKSFSSKKMSILKAIKYTFIGFFFSSITPASTGGQPMEIFFMSKEGYSTSKSAMALLIHISGYQISALTIGIIGAFVNSEIMTGRLLTLFIVGLVVNGLALSLFLICVFSKKTAKRIVNAFISLLKIFKLKNFEEKKEKIEKEVNQYIESSKYIKAHKKEFFLAILRSAVQIIVYFLIPYCIYRSFSLSEITIFKFLTLQAVLYCSVQYLPLPGSVGASESVFLRIYKGAFSKELLTGAMLINRTVSFYLYVIISAIVVSINIIVLRKRKLLKKEEQLD